MGYSNIIAILSGAADDTDTLTTAASLAQSSGGIVRIILALPVAAASIWVDAFGGAYLAEDAVRVISEANAAIRHRTSALAEEIAAKFGFECGPGDTGRRIEMADATETAWLALMREAPLADLVLMGESVARGEGFWSGVAAEALMVVRSPILLVRSKAPLEGEIAVVAWDGSLAAGRAVRAAIPLLQTAGSVVIVQDPEGLSAAEQSAACPYKLKEELDRRGVAGISIKEVSGGREGPRLVAAAKAAGAGLLVSGAYGHSRLGEAIFGGATRTFVLADFDAHHLLAH